MCVCCFFAAAFVVAAALSVFGIFHFALYLTNDGVLKKKKTQCTKVEDETDEYIQTYIFGASINAFGTYSCFDVPLCESVCIS